MRNVMLMSAFVSAALMGVPSPRSAVLVTQEPGLMGTWSLNVEKSDDPREVIQEMRGGGGAPGGAGFGGQRRGGSARGRGGGRAGGRRGGAGAGGRADGDRGPGGRGGAMAMILRTSERLSLSQGEASLNIVTASGDLSLNLDGEKWTETVESVGEVEFHVKLGGNELEVERKFKDRGVTLRETYKYKEDGDQLEVTARLSGGRLPQRIQITRVYDRVVQE